MVLKKNVHGGPRNIRQIVTYRTAPGAKEISLNKDIRSMANLEPTFKDGESVISRMALQNIEDVIVESFDELKKHPNFVKYLKQIRDTK